MVETDFSGNFTNERNCKENDIGTVLTEGSIETKKNLKDEEYTQLTIEVEINGKKLEHSPRTREGQKLQDAWGVDSKEWVGKQFTCKIVHYNAYGQEKTCVEIEPIVEAK